MMTAGALAPCSAYPSPLWGGWREAPGGGSARQCAKNPFAEAALHPSHRSLRSRCATLPTRGRDKQELTEKVIACEGAFRKDFLWPTKSLGRFENVSRRRKSSCGKLREMKASVFIFGDRHRSATTSSISFRFGLGLLSKQMEVGTECRRAFDRIRLATPFCDRKAFEFFDSGIPTLIVILPA
jgi:hypothetical protein